MTTQILNQMYGALLEAPMRPVPSIDHDVQGIYNTDDFFALNPPTAGQYQFAALENERDHDIAIVRLVVSYKNAMEMFKDFLYGVQLLSIVKNNALLSAAKKYDLAKYDITFERPGFKGGYFRELENSAGYEVRLTLKRKTQGEENEQTNA